MDKSDAPYALAEEVIGKVQLPLIDENDPKTEAELNIDASNQPTFKAGATLKASVNGGEK